MRVCACVSVQVFVSVWVCVSVWSVWSIHGFCMCYYVFVAIHFWEAIQCLSIFVMIITDSGYNYTHWWHSCGASVPT